MEVIHMKVIRVLSVIGLASYLVLQGLFYIGEMSSPILRAVIGFVGLAAGALMFISLSHWINIKKEK